MITVKEPLAKLERRRVELGISKAAVAKRAGVSVNTVKRILAGHEERPAISNLHSIAQALGIAISFGAACEIDAHELRKLQAEKKAKKIVRYVQGTMALEAQAVDSKTLQQMIERTVTELLAGPNRRLWDE